MTEEMDDRQYHMMLDFQVSYMLPPSL